MKIYDLPVMQGREKSFCGKAKVIDENNGEKVLQSYNTRVCRITSNGEFVRMWSGYSVTTMRHINNFLIFLNMAAGCGGKSWWNALPVEEPERKMGPDMSPVESYRAMMARRMGKAV